MVFRIFLQVYSECESTPEKPNPFSWARKATGLNYKDRRAAEGNNKNYCPLGDFMASKGDEKMKRIVIAICLSLLVFPACAFAESMKIFDATNVSQTVLNPLGGFTGTDYSKLWTFAQKEVSLTCDGIYEVTLSAPSEEGGSVIVDNIMYVNDANVCGMGDQPGVISPATVSNCFTSGNSSIIGNPIQNTFGGIGVVNITGLIPAGTSTAVFSLKDWGSVYGNTSLILNVEGCTINGSQGCTPGYWKNHLDAWADTDNGAGNAYSNSDKVVAIFSSASGIIDSEITLLDALKFKGGTGVDGAVRILLRAAVSALLNSSSSNVAYPIWAPQLILDVNEIINTADRDAILVFADELDLNNNLGCPLN